MNVNFKQIRLWIAKKLNPMLDYKITKSERYVIMIILKTFKLSNVELLLNSRKNEMYIDTKDVNVFIYIQLDTNTVTVVNHKYSYDIKLEDRPLQIIQYHFDKELSSRREQLKQKYLSNTENSLSSIFSDINLIKNLNLQNG